MYWLLATMRWLRCLPSSPERLESVTSPLAGSVLSMSGMWQSRQLIEFSGFSGSCHRLFFQLSYWFCPCTFPMSVLTSLSRYCL